MNDLLLSELVAEQREHFLGKDMGVPRDLDLAGMLNHDRIVAVCGIRRCGKSTLLRQIAGHLGEDFQYLNFDDERLLTFDVGHFSKLMKIFEKRKKERVLLFDEIQNVEGWERFVRRVCDEGYKLIITGSNARMLSSELSTHLTGRYSKVELYPFSFRERLVLEGLDPDNLKPSERSHVLRCFDEYMQHGGFPEYIKCMDVELLQRTYEDIIYRDIISRFNIRDVKTFQQLAHYLMSNWCSLFSYNNVKNMLGIRSATSVRDYTGFLEQSYVLFEILKYDFSLKKQHISHKKVYAIDPGMRNAVSFFFSEDRGKALENIVFLELKRRRHNIFFLKERGECDFLIERGGRIEQAIQVCADLSPENSGREQGGLEDAMKLTGSKQGSIMTYNQDDVRTLSNGQKVSILPVWRWLLERDHA